MTMAAIDFSPLPKAADAGRTGKRPFDFTRLVVTVLFLTPGLILLFMFLLIPIGKSFYYSTYDWNGLGPMEDFVGMENYVRILTQKIFQGAVLHSFTLMAMSLLLQLPLGLVLALILARAKLAGASIFRAAYFIPFVFSEVVTAILWLYVYHPENGLLNTTIQTILPNAPNTALLTDRQLVLGAIFVVITWKYFGYYVLLYMAGLQGVPGDIEDAARIDGASELGVIWNVTIPSLGATIRTTIYISMLGSLQQFIITWILTEGGPVNASELLVTYLYKFGIQRISLGYGSAVAVVIILMTLVLSIAYQVLVMRRDYASID
jgi:raffinose/stachyose/melibiose transport system permease protein